MASGDNVVVKEVDDYFRLYKSGRVERFYDVHGSFYVTPAPETHLPALLQRRHHLIPRLRQTLPPRKHLHRPKTARRSVLPRRRLCIESAFFTWVHRYVNSLASELNAVAVSVDYRLAPEVDMMTIYEDCWTALQWVASHADDNSSGTKNKDSWLTDFGDFGKLFLAGDSAGGNIVYHMTMTASKETLHNEMKITGSIFAYPYFLIRDIDIDEEGLAYKIWVNICPPLESGLLSPIDSLLINPLCEKAPSLSGLGCSRLLLCVGKRDYVIPIEIGVRFVEGVKNCGWNRELEFIEIDDGHSF